MKSPPPATLLKSNIFNYIHMKRVVDIRTLQFTNPYAQPTPHPKQHNANQPLDHHQPSQHPRTSSKLANKSQKNHNPKLSIDANPQERQKANERNRLSKSENGKRSFSRVRERNSEPQQTRIPKSYSISRYQTGRDCEDVPGEDAVRNSFHITSHSRKLFPGSSEPERMKTEPTNCLNIKSELMRRICKKITFMKRMTSESDPIPLNLMEPSISPNKSLFRFDKFYEHCVKNINRCINIYEKDANRAKDRKYFELKAEGGILAKQLKQIRNEIVQKEREGRSDYNLGVVGSGIEVRSFEKMQSHRGTHYKKKAKKINKNIYEDVKNPFKMDDMHGWEFGIEKADDFYI